MQKVIKLLCFTLGLLVIQHSVIISPAQSEPIESGPYASVKLGIAGFENARLEQSGSIQGADFLGNYFLSMAGGYSWKFFRVEVEGAFRFYDTENMDIGGVSSSSSDINSESLTLMANGYIDFKFLPIYPYVMGGVGVAVVDIRGFFIGPVNAEYDIDASLAYQMGAGIGWSMFEDTDIFMEYRYTRSNDLRFEDVFGVPFRMRYGSHTIAVGITNRF